MENKGVKNKITEGEQNRRREEAREANPLAYYALIMVIMVFGAIWLYPVLWTDKVEGLDIDFIYRDSLSISNGINPYARIHESDMIHNKKYTTYFPMFFVLGAGVIKAGISDLLPWVSFWRRIFLLSVIAIGVSIFYHLYKSGKPWLGLLGMGMWMFNRWTMHVVYLSQIEFFAILPFVLSFILMKKRPKTSLILFGLSLSIKQIAIFVLPLYVFAGAALIKETGEINSISKNRIKFLKKILYSTFLILIIPIVISIPFLAADPAALIKSVFFSATREGMDYIGGYNFALGASGISGRVLFALTVLIIIILNILKKIGLSLGIFLTLIAFIYLNPVFFNQYFVWHIPFIFFAVSEADVKK